MDDTIYLDTVNVYPDDYLRKVAGEYRGDSSGSIGGGEYSEGMPLGIYQGASVAGPQAPPGNASLYAASQDAWHTAVFGPGPSPVVSTANHAYAVNAARAIAATEAAEAAARSHPSATAVPRHGATWSDNQPIYFEASLEPSDQPVDQAAPFAFPSLHNPLTPPAAVDKYDDFTASVEHAWLRTVGLRGPLSIPVAVVAPVFGPAIDYFASTPGELSGLTFKTRGMLFDTGSPHTSFADPLVF